MTFLAIAEVSEIGPGVKTAVVAVIENQAEGIAPHGLEVSDGNVFFSRLQDPIAGAMAPHLCRG